MHDKSDTPNLSSLLLKNSLLSISSRFWKSIYIYKSRYSVLFKAMIFLPKAYIMVFQTAESSLKYWTFFVVWKFVYRLQSVGNSARRMTCRRITRVSHFQILQICIIFCKTVSRIVGNVIWFPFTLEWLYSHSHRIAGGTIWKII